MRIWITIKSILNYLYNNLIDLVWVRKVKFSDGTELTTAPDTSGNSLFDIKVLSQAVVEKGWIMLCRSGVHDMSPHLTREIAPTLYENIFSKYNNAEKSFSPLTQGSNLKDSDNNYNTFDANSFGLCVFGDTTYGIFINDYNTKIYYSSSYQSGATWTLLSDIDTFTALFKADNCIIALSSNSVYKINPSTNTITKIGNNIDSDGELGYKRVIFKLINGIIYIIKKSTSTNTSNIYKRIYYVADDTTTNTLSYIGNYSRVVCDLEYINNSWYILARNGTTFYVYKGSDLNNKTLTDTTKWELKLTYSNSNWNIDWNGEMFYGNNRLVMFFKRYQGNYDYVYTDDDFVTTNTITEIGLGTDEFCVLYFCNNVFYSISKPATFPYLYSCNIDNINNSLNWQYDTSITPTPLVSDSNLIGLFLTDTLQLMAVNLPSGTYRNFIYYRGYGNTIYTDTYKIDGNNVTINYFKYIDEFNQIWKIAFYQHSIFTAYSALGYSQYWVIDTSSEEVYLPLNKQRYVQMYIGDDYIDDDTDLISDDVEPTRCLPQASEKTFTGATVTTYVDGGINYTFTNSAITSITLNTCEYSNMETTIKFSTGNTAPTLTDNSGITWVDGSAPTLNANKNYLILVVNKIGFVKEY